MICAHTYAYPKEGKHPKQKIGARANEAVDPYNLRDLRVLLVECLKINVASVDISEIGSKNWGMCK